jgi:hypothetical protein
VGQVVMTGAGCLGGALVGAGVAAFESFGVLAGVGAAAGCAGGAMIGFFEAIPMNTLTALAGGGVDLYMKYRAVENQFSQDVAACNKK